MSIFGKTILFCPQCCTQNTIDSEFCGNCGLKLPTLQIEYINTITKASREILQQKWKLHKDISYLNQVYRQLKADKDSLETQFNKERQIFENKLVLERRLFDEKLFIENSRNESERQRFKTEVASERRSLEEQLLAEKRRLEADIAKLTPYLNEQLAHLDKLQAETAIHDLGFYKSRYNFESSDAYRLRLNRIREQQKELIKNKKAAVCMAEWSVNHSRVEGRKQTNDTLKLMLFAFNGESDVAIAKVKYNNVIETEKRINKTFELINKLVTTQQAYITQEYLNLKLEELYLAHEYQEKIYAEKEEQRRIREQIREEEIALREIEKALQDAEREEVRYSEALRKAREEVEKVTVEKQAKFLAQIELLESKLAEVEVNKERAVSRAQMTRSGHVYIISNIGSFGENVYKIGMTRRLDPMDRVIELGDASVPFRFDVHAIIYSEDAPALEHNLHQRFHDRRVNQVNHRREFFKVSLNEIAQSVDEFHGQIEFTLLAEANEYRKTLAFLSENLKQDFLSIELQETNLLEM